VEGRGYGNDEKGVGGADNVNDGIVDTAFEGAVSLDIEDSWLHSEQMQHRWSGSADCRE